MGPFRNAGRQQRPKGAPEEILTHDFLIPELGRVSPYGCPTSPTTRAGSASGLTTTRGPLPSKASGAALRANIG